MNEYIKTAQAIASLPKEAGCGEWPWYLVTLICPSDTRDETLGVLHYSDVDLLKKGEDLQGWLLKEIHGPWLNIDDLSEWSAAKWLERAGCQIINGFQIRMTEENHQGREMWHLAYKIEPRRRMPTNLDYMKAILVIGQRAFTDGGPWLEAWQRGQDA